MSAALGVSRMNEIAALRPHLMRVALSRLNDPHRAEELVQETLLAAVRGHATFGGRSRFRTWVTGILLHKVADLFRDRAREAQYLEPLQAVEPDEEAGEFDAQGQWLAPPSPWTDPQRALESKRFRALFDACLARLPSMQSRAFAMREVMGLEAGEICSALGVTPNHLGVLLHRARLGLRESLERDWFAARV